MKMFPFAAACLHHLSSVMMVGSEIYRNIIPGIVWLSHLEINRNNILDIRSSIIIRNFAVMWWRGPKSQGDVVAWSPANLWIKWSKTRDESDPTRSSDMFKGVDDIRLLFQHEPNDDARLSITLHFGAGRPFRSWSSSVSQPEIPPESFLWGCRVPPSSVTSSAKSVWF